MGAPRIARSLGAALGGGAILVGLLVAPAPAVDRTHASDAAVPVGFVVRYSGDWVIYDRGTTPLDGRVDLVQGKRTIDGACQMLQSASSDEHVTGVHGTEIAFNPETCESKYLVRKLSRKEVQALQPENVDPPLTSHIVTGTSSTSTPKQVAASKSGWTQSWYEDPPGWDVTFTFVRTNWSYNGSCVTGASGTQEHRHMAQSGWTLSTWDWDNVYNCGQIIQQHLRSLS